MTQPVILYVFAGRKANIRLQLLYLRDIVDQYDVRVEVWNLCRDTRDDQYLRSLNEPGIVVRHNFYNPVMWWEGLSSVWHHYAQHEYRDTVFVKVDDDIAFIETASFGGFLDAIRPGEVVSATTVNNGASTPLIPGVDEGFKRLGIPLLDVHTSNAYAQMCHEWFSRNWESVVYQDLETIPTQDWVSINFIGFDHSVMKFVSDNIGKPAPPHIAGRDWAPGSIVGDEGACNMLPRHVVKGFTTAHLTFGPQNCTPVQQERWLGWYSQIAEKYLPAN